MATTCQRKRKMCSKCGQNLSHAAYVHHQNPLICPGNNESKRRLCNELLQEAASDRAMQPSMSEHGITLLLNFIRAILLWAGNYLGKSAELLLLRDMIPKNVYFLKKLCNLETVSCTYVVCPKCHTLYNLEDCITKQRNGTVESAKCTFVNFPNHPHPSRRENAMHR